MLNNLNKRLARIERQNKPAAVPYDLDEERRLWPQRLGRYSAKNHELLMEVRAWMVQNAGATIGPHEEYPDAWRMGSTLALFGGLSVNDSDQFCFPDNPTAEEQVAIDLYHELNARSAEYVAQTGDKFPWIGPSWPHDGD